MKTKEDLYIIQNGVRKQIDLVSPSGITFKFLSNLFSDLSKFCASYSYTFKLPKTLNNMEAFDLVEDIRHDSTFFGKKIACEYYRDGIKLFDNSFLYINESGEEYSAVMTWGVLTWLQQVNEDGLSIKDLENDKTGAELTTVLFRSTHALTSESQTMDAKNFNALYRCGTKFETDIVPPLIPVRYLLNKIAQRYGMTNACSILSFVGNEALTNTQLSIAAKRNIVEDGVLPLVSGKWSDKYAKTQNCITEKISTVMYDSTYSKIFPLFNAGLKNAILYLANRFKWLRFGNISGNTEYVTFLEDKGSAICNTTPLDVANSSYTINEQSTGLYIGFVPKDKTKTLKLHGRFRMNGYGKLRLMRFHYYIGQTEGSAPRYVPMMEDDGTLKDYIELTATEVENESGMYEFNFDPAEGGKEVSLEPIEELYDLWAIQLVVYDTSNFITDGYINFIPEREDITIKTEQPTATDTVDLFYNLPDIKIIDFIKSLFYIENSYPILQSDGRIGQIKYGDLYVNINAGTVYDWSNKIISTPKEDTLKYTNGNLGRRNFFCMKNYSSGDKSNDSSLEYEVARASFVTENSHLDAEKTIYTFPYASAAKVTKDGYSAGDTFIFWQREDSSNEMSAKAAGVDPIIGRIVPYSRAANNGYSLPITAKNYLKMKIWQVADMEYDQTILSHILRKPYVVTTKVILDGYTISTIDYSKPVYLQRYNSFFGIISLQLDSKGVVKAELIKLPPLGDLAEGKDIAPEVTITGTSTIYKAPDRNAIGQIIAEANIKRGSITRMVVKMDGSNIYDGAIESFNYEFSVASGDHVFTATAYSSNGLSSTTTFNVHLLAVTDQSEAGSSNLVVDFMSYDTQLIISNSKRNITSVEIAAFNATSIQSLKLYKYPKGSANEKELMGETTESSLICAWEYFDQLSTNALSGRYWTLQAELKDNDGQTVTKEADVWVYPASNLIVQHSGVASNPYFMMVRYNAYMEGQYMNINFGQSFACRFGVYAGNMSPYYVLLHFRCYYGGSESDGIYEYEQGIDPYYGNNAEIQFTPDMISQYHAIRCSAEAWFKDDNDTHFVSSGYIWIYNSNA